VTFLPVQVRESQPQRIAVTADDGGAIEVLLNNGRRVRLTGAVDSVVLAQVLAAVEGERRC
jgi:hypothetical protein